jgi:hypothetical protein
VSPDADRVAVGDNAVSYTIVPALEAVNKPIFATVTGRESETFAVKVLVNVNTDVPVVCAYVAKARTKPPLAVAISPVNVVSAGAGVVVFAVNARYCAVEVPPAPAI